MAENSIRSNDASAERASVGWDFFFEWMLASAFGFSIGSAIGLPVAVLGLSQWLVLRRKVSRVGWWIPATIVGGVLASGFVDMLFAAAPGGAAYDAVQVAGSAPHAPLIATGGAIGGSMLGALTGLYQWGILQRKVPQAGWWLATSILGYALGGALGAVVSGRAGTLVGFAVYGLVVGSISGAILLLLVRQTIPPASEADLTISRESDAPESDQAIQERKISSRLSMIEVGLVAIAFAGITSLGVWSIARGGRSWNPDAYPSPPPADRPRPAGQPTREVDPELQQLASTEVMRNDDWTPVIQDFDGVEMALVPVGCFMMGDESGGKFYVPVVEQCFEMPFWIDVYEVTNAQFRAFGGQARVESYWTDDNRPRETITWFEAANFCELRGVRLPTEVEWEYAARGPDGLIYPWGNEFDGNNLIWNTSQTADVGSKPEGASWVGALDMSGNVSEWTSSRHEFYPYNPNDGREIDGASYTRGYRVSRGGMWGFDWPEPFRTWTRSRTNLYEDVGRILGLRCARSF